MGVADRPIPLLGGAGVGKNACSTGELQQVAHRINHIFFNFLLTKIARSFEIDMYNINIEMRV